MTAQALENASLTLTAQSLAPAALTLTAQSLPPEALTLTAQSLPAEVLTAQAQTAQAQTGPPTIAVDAVALTATALADLLQPTLVANGSGGGAVATPTIEGGSGPILPTALPDTGLFDDLAAGGTGSMTGLFLAALGLIGMIIVSRRVRAVNR